MYMVYTGVHPMILYMNIIFKAIHTQNKYRHVLYCNYYSLLYSVLYSIVCVWHLFVYDNHRK